MAPENVVPIGGPLVAKTSAPRPRADALHELFSLALRSCVKEANMTSNLARVVTISAALAGSPRWRKQTTLAARTTLRQSNQFTRQRRPPPIGPADMFVTKQAVTEWRAPSLLASQCTGSTDAKKVGTIKDVLIDHDGSARVTAIGVGGVPWDRSEADRECPSLRRAVGQTEGRVVPATDQPPADPARQSQRLGSNSADIDQNGSSGRPKPATDIRTRRCSGVTLAQSKMAPRPQVRA